MLLRVGAVLALLVAIPAGLVAVSLGAGSTTSVIAADGFTRTVVAGLGTADTGGKYTLTAGPGKPISVAGGLARITRLAAGGSSAAYLTAAVATDTQVQISLSIPAGGRVPVGLYSSVDSRRQPDGSVYRIKLKIGAGGALGLRIARIGLRGSDLTLAAVALPMKLAPGRTVTLASQVVGANPVVISARAWLKGAVMPSWQLVAKDSAKDALTKKGSVGFWNYLSGGAAPATFTESGLQALALSGLAITSTPSSTAPATSTLPTGAAAGTSTAASTSAATATSAPVSSGPTTTAPSGTPIPDQTAPPSSSGARGAAAVGTSSYPVPSDAIYVSSGGDDNADGGSAAPLRTIAAAIGKSSAGQTIVVRAGVYHESVTVPVSKTNLTIQAYPGEAVWFDGSSVVSGWTQVGNTWVHSGWTKRFDHSASFSTGSDNPDFINPSYPLAAWPDQVFLDGQQLRQVSPGAQVGAGTFAVDYNAQTLSVGTNPAGAEVRSSDLEQAFNVIASGVTLQGIGVRRYGTPLPMLGTVRLAGGNDTARDLVIADNATQGLSFRNNGNIADHVSVIDNGMTGVHANNSDNLTITNSVISGNNAEHFNESPSAAGIKVTRSRTVSINHSDFDNNLSKGIWLDESVVGFVIADNSLSGNATGITTELSDTGIVANNSVDGGSRGLWIFDTGNVKVFNNYFVNNPIGAVFLNQDQRREANPQAVGHDPRQPIPDATCPWLTRNITVANNVFGKSVGSSMFQFYALDKATGISADSMNLTVDGNLFTYKDTNSDPSMVGWGGSDNVTVAKYETPAAFNNAKGKSWTNMQTGPGVGTASAINAAASAGSPSAVPLPSDVASVIGAPAGSKHVGRF
jgi:parallel beta-helix repeat protein